ncbi:MAG: DNA primase [Rhodobacteraceae bacterium]|nr:DNA primase [Paracoccaceae bacterium]MCY4137325.1 DNA primase [Paracoccaceae bacterium]
MTILPDGFIDQLRDRISIARIIGEKLSWDAKKSNPGRGEYWALCPFHQEKTPSFKVDDRKGFYYCFGCHSKGDAIRFVRETKNVGFMDAVAMLAREAGMDMPAPDPKLKEKIDRQSRLVDIQEQALSFFRLQLNSAKAEAARRYLDDRGLSENTIKSFEIGYAPKGRPSLCQHLSGKGVQFADMIEAGLAIQPDDGGAPFDRFRDRIMFPIRNPRGSCVAFGGRAMDPKTPAKYMNSPETPVFDKGRMLYNLGPARESLGKGGQLVVAEGYMDVISLVSAGITNAVAPLGTAITESQLLLMWRISREPVITLDGDAAGRRAALRLIELAFPLLEAGRSLRFVMMPEGKDPDDLIRGEGVVAMRELLAQSQPMVNLLWQRETEGREFDSPERRAALEKSLEEAVGRIRDRSIQQHYRNSLRQMRRELFGFSRQPSRNVRGGARPGGRGQGTAAPVAQTRRSSIANSGRPVSSTRWRHRESVLLASAILNPASALKLESELEACPIETPSLKSLHNRFMALLSRENPETIDPDSFRNRLKEAMGYDPLEKLRKEPGVRNSPCLSDNADPAMMERTLEETVRVHSVEIGHLREISEFEQDIVTATDENMTYRLKQVAQDVDRVRRSTTAETLEDDEEKDLSQRLRSLVESRVWDKP